MTCFFLKAEVGNHLSGPKAGWMGSLHKRRAVGRKPYKNRTATKSNLCENIENKNGFFVKNMWQNTAKISETWPAADHRSSFSMLLLALDILCQDVNIHIKAATCKSEKTGAAHLSFANARCILCTASSRKLAATSHYGWATKNDNLRFFLAPLELGSEVVYNPEKCKRTRARICRPYPARGPLAANPWFKAYQTPQKLS